MSSPLAIGAVSAVLRNLLDNGLIETGGGPVNVSAVAPDVINLEEAGFTPRLNLFLYQVTPNSGWRNSGLPSRSATSGERLTNAPLALDLHYLLTAYARADFEAEILLGYAMHLLHERPVLDRAAIRRALSPGPIGVSLMPPAFQALVASDLADQVEQIKITLSVQSSDEMSKLWSAIQSKYRPSSAYQVSVVLIEGKQPAVSPLPVLTRGRKIAGTQRDEGVAVNPDVLPPLPTLFEAKPPDNQPAARLGESVTVEGIRLAGAGHEVRLVHRLFAAPVTVSPVTVSANGKEATFTIPNAPAALAAGQLSATIHFTPAGELVPRETNAVPLVIAPILDLPPVSITRGATVDVTLTASPEVRPEQQAVLMLDGAEAVAAPRTLATDPLLFKFPASLPAKSYLARLRVDGSDSILIIRKDPVPVFDPTQEITLP
jgi:Pvc16 N-terminal domain